MLDLRVRHRAPELAVLDPATGEAIGCVPASGPPEAHDAVGSARAAHGAWARTMCGVSRMTHCVADVTGGVLPSWLHE